MDTSAALTFDANIPLPYKPARTKYDPLLYFRQASRVLGLSNPQLNLYIARHGQTEGNVNRELYKTKADHAMRLTERGVRQADDGGLFMADRLYYEWKENPRAFGNIRVWFSPYYRARETAYHFLVQLAEKFDPRSGILSYREDPFLFEQKAGLFDGMDDGEFKEKYPELAADYQKHLDYNGRAYAISPQGESRIDIVIRTKHFYGTLLDDLRKHNIRHAIIINHGVTVRAITMGWMRYPPEWLDAEQNPGNCWIRHIHGTRSRGYMDEGYIYGSHLPALNDRMATQKQLDHAEDIFMLKPGRPNGIVPKGVKALDPFAKYRNPA